MNAGIAVFRLVGLLDALSSFSLAGWTESDLYALVNDALRRLTLDVAIIGRAQSVSVLAGASTAPLANGTLAVLEAAYNGEGLEIVEVRDLDNEEAYWATRPDFPKQVTFEQHGQRTARFDCTAIEAGTFQYVSTAAAPTLSGFTMQPAPPLVAVTVLLESLASARRQETLFQQLDTAAALQSFADLLKDSMRSLYGRAA